MNDLHLADFLAPYRPLKILLTRRQGDKDATDKMKPHATDELHAYSDGKIQSHTIDASQILRDVYTNDYLGFLLGSLLWRIGNIVFHRVNDGVLTPRIVEMSMGLPAAIVFGVTDGDGVLRHRIVEMSMGLPAAIVVLAMTLDGVIFDCSPKQRNVFKRAVLSSFPSVSNLNYGDIEDPDRMRATSRFNPILYLAYELLKTDKFIMKSSTVDCFLHSLSFFEHCECVNYQELIAHWILEGYFDPVRSITKAYKDGHVILMKLIKRGILKIQEGNMVMPEMAMKNLIDLRCRGLLARSRIALAKFCGSDMKKGLGKINQGGDIIEAVQTTRKRERVTTVLVSGNRLCREIPETYFEELKDLEILGLFKPTLDHFVPSLSKLVKLRVLVIRDCDRLKDIEELMSLEGLRVLEVSGASSLKKISDEFFKALSKLQSLHLSELQITSSPSSISQLTELHFLIIKDCPLLENLPDIQELVKLEVVDLSGGRGLQTCSDNKNFYHLTQLQHLDFSGSQIERLPMFQDFSVSAKLHSLTRLLLRNCSRLSKLPNLKPLSGLQILDLSGCSSLVKMLEVCFEDKKELRILNLSGTNIRQLPSTIEELSSLNELLLRGCTNLEVLPNIQKLENLEVIDIFGNTMEKIEGSLFQDFSVPTKLHSLTQLLLRNCNRLSKLPNLKPFSRLQILDLSGCSSLVTMLEVCFEDKKELRILNLSGTNIRQLPNLKPLSGLQILDLSGCSSLVKMLEVCFEDKKELRILNLSGTNLRQLPSTIEELSSLNELLLRGCTNLEVLSNIQKLKYLEVIDVSGSTKLEEIEGSFEDMSYLREVNLSGTKVDTPGLPKKSSIHCVKHIILADGMPFEGEDWREVSQNISNVISENDSSSDGVVNSQEISEKDSKDIQSHEPGSSDFPVRRGISMEGFGQFPIYRALYQKSMPFVDFESHPKVLEIYGSNNLGNPCDLDKEALANAKFVSFVDTSSSRLTSVFNETKSVKGCWLRMCKDIEYLFSGVDEESLGSLEILSITNLRLLGSICSGGSFKNLKRLSVDCCPNIKTLFLEASQLPSNLEVLHIKFCEKLETVFKEGQEVSTLVTLSLHELPVLSAIGGRLPNLEIFNKRNCPNLDETKDFLKNLGSDWVFVDRFEASPQD